MSYNPNETNEYSSQSNFPSTGRIGTLYLAIDNNKLYRWDGSSYQQVSPGSAVFLSSANNGLNATGGNVQLGGSLATTTIIDQNSKDITFDGTGNFGIGVTGPTARLEVGGTTGAISGLKLNSLTSSTTAQSSNGKVLSVDTVGNVVLQNGSQSTSVGLDFNTLDALLSLRITSGTYTGAFRVAAAGMINWYFNNLALIQFVRDIPEYVRQYLELYLSKVATGDATNGYRYILDIDSDLSTPVNPDSHDSYAATFLSLVKGYVEATGNIAWFTSRVNQITDIAYYNLALAQKASGLVNTFQTSAWGSYSSVAQLMDNAEAWRGLDDFIFTLNYTGQTSNVAYYTTIRDGVLNGIFNSTTGLRDATNNRFFVNDTRPTATGVFYPDAICQIWPELKRLPEQVAGAFAGARSYFESVAPNWHHNNYDLSGFVWPHIAALYAMRGEVENPSEQLRQVNAIWSSTPNMVRVDRLGFIHLTKQFLRNINYYTNTIPSNKLGTGSRDGTKFLRDDGVYSSIPSGGSPGGSTTQVQYNNAGAFAGASKVNINNNGSLELLVDSSPLTPSAGEVGLFARSVADRILPAYMGPSGLDSAMQPLIGRNSVSIFRAYPGARTVTAIGMALTATGTATAQGAFATTNIYTSTIGLEYLVTTAATNAVAGFRVGTTTATMPYWRGNSAGRGGFTVIVRFGPATGVGTTAGTDRMFVGMQSGTAAPTDVNPSTLTNIVGAGYDSTDANWQILFNDGTSTATKVDTGVAVPTADRSNRYEVAIFCPPNGSAISVQFTDLSPGGITITASNSVDIPSNTTFLGIRGYHSVGGTSSVVGFGLMSIYSEIDI